MLFFLATPAAKEGDRRLVKKAGHARRWSPKKKLGCARKVVQHWLGCDLVKQLSDGHVKKWDNRVPTTRQVVQHRLGFEVVKQLRAGHAKRGVATCPPLARLCNTGLAVRHRETSACNGINHYQ